ncbi:putative nucleotidyltransferase with HDIG domain [Sphingomonas sp. BE138]|nr:putative nucleotidyltransferase with HDIG domain [Sphingomonas sp. BE138]
MLVTIKTDDLRIGMFVHAVAGGWMASPFWRRQFVLTKQGDLDKLRKAGVGEVVIDLSKGVGPLAAPAAQAMTPHVEEPDVWDRETGATPSEPGDACVHVAPPVRRRRAPAAEQRAQAVVDASKHAVRDMFEDVRLGKAVDAGAMVPVIDRIFASVTSDAAAMLNVTRLKSNDEYTYLHSIAVAALMIHFAQALNLPEPLVRDLGLSGLLHDIGKMTVPKALLQKSGQLEPEEVVLLRHHPERGHAMLSAGAALPDVVLDVCLHHHERIDGRGYPHRLAGEQLSLAVRISAICDVYDAVTSQRPYKRVWLPSEALARMQSWTGHFDPDLLVRFIDSIGIHPVGGLVRLHSSRLALVMEGNDRRPTEPRVRVFYDIPALSFVPQHDIIAAPDTDPIHRAECGERWFGPEWSAVAAAIRAGTAPLQAIPLVPGAST